MKDKLIKGVCAALAVLALITLLGAAGGVDTGQTPTGRGFAIMTGSVIAFGIFTYLAGKR